jgi:hypothetical protein
MVDRLSIEQCCEAAYMVEDVYGDYVNYYDHLILIQRYKKALNELVDTLKEFPFEADIGVTIGRNLQEEIANLLT